MYFLASLVSFTQNLLYIHIIDHNSAHASAYPPGGVYDVGKYELSYIKIKGLQYLQSF